VEGEAETQPQAAGWLRLARGSGGPRWWSIQPPPAAPRISALRAYCEVLGVFAAFFAASVVVGAEALAERYPRPTGSWAIFLPASISLLGSSVLAVLVVVLLSARRGITARSLGFRWPAARDGKPGAASTARVAVWAILALLAGGLATVALANGNALAQPAHQDASYLTYAMAASVTAGVVEETVVLAFVVTTLRQAGRPLPEILLVAVILRCSYHDYYGLGVIGIAVWAAVFAWLFLRTGSLLPLIIVHAAWDANIFLAQRWHAVQIGSALVFLGLVVIAAISWWAGLGARRAQARSGCWHAGPQAMTVDEPLADKPPPRR
jgi:membrane protease YdiL (CAAX protease family)